jgi:hypothetical protein
MYAFVAIAFLLSVELLSARHRAPVISKHPVDAPALPDKRGSSASVEVAQQFKILLPHIDTGK